MNPLRRLILIIYLTAVLLVILFIPWRVDSRFYVDRSVEFLFKPPIFGNIDYGMLVIELVAVTALAGIVWLLQDKLLSVYLQRELGKMHFDMAVKIFGRASSVESKEYLSTLRWTYTRYEEEIILTFDKKTGLLIKVVYQPLIRV
jgi:hypothetical protein